MTGTVIMVNQRIPNFMGQGGRFTEMTGTVVPCFGFAEAGTGERAIATTGITKKVRLFRIQYDSVTGNTFIEI
jgi:hypothetical protein